MRKTLNIIILISLLAQVACSKSDFGFTSGSNVGVATLEGAVSNPDNGNGNGYGGDTPKKNVFNMKNGIARCEMNFSDAEKRNYVIACKAMVTDLNGDLVIADTIEEGILLTWSLPDISDPSNPNQHSLTSNGGLSYSVAGTLATVPSNINLTLIVMDAVTNEQKEITPVMVMNTPVSNAFISVWKTDNQGTSHNNQITLPLEQSGTYNFTVNWGDDTSDTITQWDDLAVTHTYLIPGTYTVSITGTIIGFSFHYRGDCSKLMRIDQWGSLKLGNSGYYFDGAINLTIIATDMLNLTSTTNMTHAFADCISLTTVPRMNEWDMSAVTDMTNMFFEAFNFNQDIGSWNVSNVISMKYMFNTATAFNQNIGNWNVGKVKNMTAMFARADAFNQDIGRWNTSSVTEMESMFHQGANFNKHIGDWDVSKVVNMRYMFFEAKAFNQNIGNWNISSVTIMSNMFQGASSFNQDIGGWNTSNVQDMGAMFHYATTFDQDLGRWNVSSVTNFSLMFTNVKLSTSNYNAILNGWSAQTLQSGMDFYGGNSTYSSAAVVARQKLVDQFGWTIVDGGQSN